MRHHVVRRRLRVKVGDSSGMTLPLLTAMHTGSFCVRNAAVNSSLRFL